MDLTGKSIVVTGGSRGLGAGIVDALVASDAHVTVLAHNRAQRATSTRTPIHNIAGDITDSILARQVIAEQAPHAIILNAGAIPPTVPIDDISWESFSEPWTVDVRGALAWTQAALTVPLRPGGIVLMVSSGAAINGSPLSGGYAGAKRMLWLMANYANALSVERDLGLLFQTILPLQMMGETGVGDAAAAAYSKKMGVDPADFLARFGRPMTASSFGAHIVEILQSEDRAVRAYGVKGDTGLTKIETVAN